MPNLDCRQFTGLQISVSLMTFDGVSLKKFNDTAPESAEQDQTARTCRLILLYTVRKVNPMVSKVLINVNSS